MTSSSECRPSQPAKHWNHALNLVSVTEEFMIDHASGDPVPLARTISKLSTAAADTSSDTELGRSHPRHLLCIHSLELAWGDPWAIVSSLTGRTRGSASFHRTDSFPGSEVSSSTGCRTFSSKANSRTCSIVFT